MILKLPQTRSHTNLKYSSANGLRKYDRGEGGKVPRDLLNDSISEVNMGMYSINSSRTKSHKFVCTG